MFATNTSGFVIAEVFRDVGASRRPLCVGMHFSTPVPVMTMCEVIYTGETSQTTLDTARGVAEKAGRAV
jgi:3-hydroxyacyl-CoA dehydrogenase